MKVILKRLHLNDHNTGLNDEVPGGGVLPSSRLMRMCRWMGSNCFTTGLTITGLHFYKSYLNGVAHLQDFRGQKIQV